MQMHACEEPISIYKVREGGPARSGRYLPERDGVHRNG